MDVHILGIICFLYRMKFTFSYSATEKILNGFPTEIENTPYQAFLGHCGAVIISRKHLLTAGHCLAKPVYRVGVGSTLRNHLIWYRVKKQFQHENYTLLDNGHYAMNDIGLIELGRPLVYSNKVSPVPLTEIAPEQLDFARASGWGVTQDGNVPPDLRGLDVYIVDNKKCEKHLLIEPMGKTIICSNHNYPTHHVFHGDSGGPLVSSGKLVGIVSFGGETQNNYVAYSSVAHFRNWILEKIGSKYIENNPSRMAWHRKRYNHRCYVRRPNWFHRKQRYETNKWDDRNFVVQ